MTKRKGKEESKKGYSGHGLRKSSAIIAVESGVPDRELNAMFGWTGHQMASLYTKHADRKKLAARAMAKWKRPSSDAGDFLQLEDDEAEAA
ncbi:tyrosine-type recombinase/integrase [Bradyrhizobium sp. UFLA05-112]